MSDGSFSVLTTICSCCARDELSPEDFLSVVKATLQWQQQSLAALYHAWKEGGAALIAAMKEQVPSVGQVWRSGWVWQSNSVGSSKDSLT